MTLRRIRWTGPDTELVAPELRDAATGQVLRAFFGRSVHAGDSFEIPVDVLVDLPETSYILEDLEGKE